MKYTIFLKTGTRSDLPKMYAYEKGVFVYPFYGDQQYIDPFDNSVWNWTTFEDVDEILGVSQNTQPLIVSETLADCILVAGSWFWDDENGLLYIHWIDSVDDFYVSRENSTLAKIGAGYASGYHSASGNVFDGVFYPPIISDVGGMSVKVDPVKFGMISVDAPTITFSDNGNAFLDILRVEAVGVPVWVYVVPDDVTTLSSTYRRYVGYYNGITHDRSKITWKLAEYRQFNNAPVCQNVLSTADYANCGDKAGKLVPVAFGDIRRGKMLLTNKDSLTEAASGSAVFLVGDVDFGAILAVDYVYDKDGASRTIVSRNLAVGTVTVTKPAGVAVSDLDEWTWQGKGSNLSSGSYNNGLNIIRTAFRVLAGIPYLSSTFDQGAWGLGTVGNPQAIGMSIQSDKGFLNELIEPITASLQGVVQYRGDGKLSWYSRNPDAAILTEIPQYEQLDEPTIEIDPKETVSTLAIQYAPNFTKDSDFLTYTDTSQKEKVATLYGIDRAEPLSPVKTVLCTTADAQSLAAEIMETSADPARIIRVRRAGVPLETPFSIVRVDVGLFNETDWRICEVLNIDPDFIKNEYSLRIREIDDYEYIEPVYIQGRVFYEPIFADAIFGTTRY